MENKTKNNIKTLMDNKNIKGKDMAEYLHVSESSFSEYLNKRREMPSELFPKVADYLDCSTDYLYGRTNHAKSLNVTVQEYKLIEKFRNCSKKEQDHICELVDLLDANKNK